MMPKSAIARKQQNQIIGKNEKAQIVSRRGGSGWSSSEPIIWARALRANHQRAQACENYLTIWLEYKPLISSCWLGTSELKPI